MTPSPSEPESLALPLIGQLRALVDNQEGGDAVVLVQRQLFNRVVGMLVQLSAVPQSEALARVHKRRADAYEPIVDLLCGLNVTDGELLRLRNRCENADGMIHVSATFLQKLVDHIRELRTVAGVQPDPPRHPDVVRLIKDIRAEHNAMSNEDAYSAGYFDALTMVIRELGVDHPEFDKGKRQ